MKFDIYKETRLRFRNHRDKTFSSEEFRKYCQTFMQLKRKERESPPKSILILPEKMKPKSLPMQIIREFDTFKIWNKSQTKDQLEKITDKNAIRIIEERVKKYQFCIYDYLN